MRKIIRSLKGFIFRVRDFLVSILIIAFLFTFSFLSFLSSEESTNSSEGFIASLFGSSLFDFSSTDLILVFLAIYAVLKKPWRENLAGHFKKAYRAQLKSIQKTVKERDELREECNTFSVHQMSFDSPESMNTAMREQDGYPAVNDLGKQLWDGNRESLLKGLEEVESIKNSKDAATILGNYAQMVNIDFDLRKETFRLQELKSLSRTGEIRGSVWFSDEFAEEFPEQQRFHISIRLKPEYISDGCVSRFWLERNIFYPYDPNTGKKTKKYNPSYDNRWALLSMSSPYWKYVGSIILNLEDANHQLTDGRWVRMPPKDFLLPDGSRLLDLKGKTLFPMRIERDGETW
ncbi:MAG: hypothetical protein OXU36_20970 [Candidatus Poribacteria bacterium]|nr:hypothetical protein [Candidatus Poribacteria bacterium]